MHRTRHREPSRSPVNVAVVSVCLLVGIAIVAGPAAGQAGLDPVLADMAGNGSVDDPYVITNATELQAMSGNLSAHYVLGNDVDASVATVADGVVSAHDAGTSTLEAEHAGFADTATLDVVASDGGDGGGGGGALDPPGTPAIGVDSVTIGDDVLAPGESTTITVTLANDGDGDGTHEVVLSVDGRAVDSMDAFVPAGGTQTVTFAPSFDEVGEYAVGVDGTDAGTVTVLEGRSGESPTATDDPTGPQTTTDAATDPDEGGGPTPGENGGAPQPERDGGLQLVAGLLTVGAALGAVVGLSFWLRTRD